MKKILGTNTINYNEDRNFCGLPFSKYIFQKKQNLNKIPAYLYFKLKNRTHYYYWNTFNDWNLNKVELFHFFNAVSVGKTPWITTFETSLPRWGEYGNPEKGLKLLAGNSCKKVIAMSECAAKIQRGYMEKEFPQYAEAIEGKMMVLHPGQKRLISDINEKGNLENLSFTLIGSDFFRKGGKEILWAFDQLHTEGIKNWKLNIISKMDYGDYASQTTKEDLDYATGIIAKYPDNITHHFRLPNSEVLALLKQTDVGLLPTYGDTYGYSVLEAQASGCPVITTNIRALPEVNNDKTGWILQVPIDEKGNGILGSKSERDAFSKAICDQLIPTLKGILESPQIVREKGILALEKIERENSIEKKTTILESIYDGIG